MLSKSEWLKFVFLPLFLVLLVDQASKHLAVATLAEPIFKEFYKLVLFKNHGFMMGSLKDAPKLYTVVVPSTIGAFLLYLFLLFQFFLPIRSPWMRIGVAIFAGGVLGNILDRVFYGYVIDFIQLSAYGKKTGIFNIADGLQWVGVTIFFSSYIANGSLLYPPEQRRGRKWIDPAFQVRYCLTLVGIGLAFSIIGGTLSYTFLRTTIGQIATVNEAAAASVLTSFVSVYTSFSVVFFVTLFVLGVHLSHRIVGPVKAFERFLNDVLSGKVPQFKLRRRDEFTQFESLAERFHDVFGERLAINPEPLAAMQPAPATIAKTYDGKDIEIARYLGRRVWLIFYRYATCPLCVLHLRGILGDLALVAKSGGVVLAVFESRPEQFLKEDTGKTASLLQSVGIPLIADPGRRLYRLYRTRRSVLALLNPKVLVALIRAHFYQFRQASIDGDLGQLPAHFFIDEDGLIRKAYYGKTQVDHPDRGSVLRFFGLNASGEVDENRAS